MDSGDRLKVYSAMAEASRKWVSVLDAKASFLSVLNTATLVFIWSSSKLSEAKGVPYCLSMVSTILLLAALFIGLRVILPRTRLEQAFGKPVQYVGDYQAVSYFGYVAQTYSTEKIAEFIAAVDAMDEDALSHEALEQHFTISHLLNKKSEGLAISGWLWMLSVVCISAALFLRG